MRYLETTTAVTLIAGVLQPRPAFAKDLFRAAITVGVKPSNRSSGEA